MKLIPYNPAGSRPGRHSGFTLVEMMVSTGIYLAIFIGVMVAIQVFALRVYTLAATKLTATQASRKALNQIRDDIRQAKGVLVGTADSSGTFTAYAGTNLAQGNALKTFATTNFSGPPYSLYFLKAGTFGGDSSNCLFWISVTPNSSNITKLATYITNMTDVFAAEDCWGHTYSNVIANNQIFSVKFQFTQWEYPIAVVNSNGGANAYDYYQLRTKVCRRALD